MSIGLKFVELTADGLGIFLYNDKLTNDNKKDKDTILTIERTHY